MKKYSPNKKSIYPHIATRYLESQSLCQSSLAQCIETPNLDVFSEIPLNIPLSPPPRPYPQIGSIWIERHENIVQIFSEPKWDSCSRTWAIDVKTISCGNIVSSGLFGIEGHELIDSYDLELFSDKNRFKLLEPSDLGKINNFLKDIVNLYYESVR